MKRLPLWLTLAAQFPALFFFAVIATLDAIDKSAIGDGWVTLFEVATVLLIAGGFAQILLLPWLWWWRRRMGLGWAATSVVSLVGVAYAITVGVFLIGALGTFAA